MIYNINNNIRNNMNYMLSVINNNITMIIETIVKIIVI